MKRQIRMGALIFLLISLVGVSGCRDDLVVSDLETLRVNAARVGAEDRIEQALSKWRNKRLDPEPILIFAGIARPVEAKMFCLATFDEDRDLLGLVVEEKHTDANGATTRIVEEYPVFVHRPVTEVVELHGLPVRIRDADQRKDVQQWQDYVNEHAIDLSKIRDVEYYRNTLPPVWISIPEPNSVDVCVYIYDRAGNRSEEIRLGKPGG